MVIDNKFEISAIVFLKTDTDQYERIITRICAGINGITYELAHGTITSWHYDFEISEEKNILITTNRA